MFLLILIPKVRLIDCVLILSLISVVLNLKYVTGIKCGQPGQSRKSDIKIGKEEYNIYDENSVIKYSCDYNDAQFLIGHQERKCEHGVWTNSVPKCASLYTYGFNLSYTPNGNAVNVSLSIPAKIAGISVKISSQDRIQIVNIKNVPSPECITLNLTSNEKIPTHIRKRFSTLFECPTKDVDINKHTTVSWILVTFNDKFRNCELTSCPAILEYIELYEVSQDSCEQPDQPAFGEAELIYSNQSLIYYRYKCEENFYLKKESNYRKNLEVICPVNGDWSSSGSTLSTSSTSSSSSLKSMPKCLPNVTCKVMEVKPYLNVVYTRLWDSENGVVGSMAVYDCSYNDSRINGSKTRVCMNDGNWSGEEPECIEKPTTSTSTHASTTTFETTRREVTPMIIPLTYPPNVPNTPPPNVHQYSTIITYIVPPTGSPNTNSNDSSSTLAISIGFSIFGALLSAMIAIGIIYYLLKRKPNGGSNSLPEKSLNSARNPIPVPRYNSHPRNRFAQPQVSQRGDTFYDDNVTHLCSSQSEDRARSEELYDSAGYIQIEAVDTIRMNNLASSNAVSSAQSHNYEYGRTFRNIPPRQDK